MSISRHHGGEDKTGKGGLEILRFGGWRRDHAHGQAHSKDVDGNESLGSQTARASGEEPWRIAQLVRGELEF